ncbi:dynamin family protein [Nostoc sp.]|uniref:dynamin family protein n=1 Tax=Nostoc sp. TaxID=1180 RepID=UPI002FF7E12B
MSSEQFQAAHDSIYNTGTRLLQYLQEIRQGRLSEGDDTKSLQSVEDEINDALHALKEQKYQVAVIAAMKAGKSTFLNAVIGADVLASETAACTICRTDVRHIPFGQIPRLLEYRDGQRRPFVITEGEAGEIQQKFLERTREIREKGNPDNTTSFKIEHPIEAIGTLSSLSGFTLVDTPGPNEWESANFNVKLKETTLKALRNCNAILFVLNYASYKDNAISDLFKEIIENRKEILSENTGKIYFILNKVDQKTEKDREIGDVIEDLKRELITFGFPNPIIYPASSRQGLLAKLIQQDKATDSQIKDFEDFFSAKYAERDARGRKVIPLPSEIASKALDDSGLPIIQETVIQTIIQNAGWNLLSDALAKLDKAAKVINSLLYAQIAGWNTQLEELKEIVDEYRNRSESARKNVDSVKKSVDEREKELISEFSQGINDFAEGAKLRIQDEIELIVNSRVTKSENSEVEQKVEPFPSKEIPSNNISLDLTVPNAVPVLGGFSVSFKVQRPLFEAFGKVIPKSFSSADSSQSQSYDPYKMRFETKEDAQEIERTINEFCTPHIHSWWVDTQDKLVRKGTGIRYKLVQQIQEQIQEISNELSSYLGEALHVELSINPIQFPSFEFQGIDAQIQHQVEVYMKYKKEIQYRPELKMRLGDSLCKPVEIYIEPVPHEVNISVQEKYSFYEVDLRETAQAIKLKIDNQASGSRDLLQQVIEKQVEADFSSAKKQINDYINRFQSLFDNLLKERAMKEAEAPQILARLESQKVVLNEYLHELTVIRVALNSWKPE